MSVTVGESLCQRLWERVYVSDCGRESLPATVGKSLTMSVTVGESLCQRLWERV